MRRFCEVAVLVSSDTSNDSGLTANAGAGTALPVTGTTFAGESGSLLWRVSWALTRPGAVGAKRTITLRAAWGASENTPWSTETLGWLLAMPATLSTSVPGFDTVRVWVGCAPTKIVPKSKLAGLTARSGAPVTTSWAEWVEGPSGSLLS